MKWSVLLDFKAEITQRVPSWKDFLGYELEVVRNACRFACRICDDCDLPALTLCYNVLTNLRLPNLDAVGPWEAMPESTLAFTGEFNRSDGFEVLPLYMRFNFFREPEVLECHMSELFCAIGEMAVMLLAAGKINDDELDSCLSSALRALGDGSALELCRLSEVDDETWAELTDYVAFLGKRRQNAVVAVATVVGHGGGSGWEGQDGGLLVG
eukprot:Skav208737  [mRNA]  locus=scaffold742:154114:157066:- [translate_table: standard]